MRVTAIWNKYGLPYLLLRLLPRKETKRRNICSENIVRGDMARIATSKGYPLFEKAAGICNLVAENALNNKKLGISKA